MKRHGVIGVAAALLAKSGMAAGTCVPDCAIEAVFVRNAAPLHPGCPLIRGHRRRWHSRLHSQASPVWPEPRYC